MKENTTSITLLELQNVFNSTLSFEEDLKFMELLLSKNKDLVKIKKVKDEECGIEITYITIKKNE